jgi:hypothetical protein
VLCPDFIPAICAVNKQMNQEATLAYVKSRCFVIANSQAAEWMFAWLSRLEKGFEHVRGLVLHEYDPTKKETAYPKLLGVCTRVAALKVWTPFLEGLPSSQAIKDMAESPQADRHVEAFRELTELRSLEWHHSVARSSIPKLVAARIRLHLACDIQLSSFSAMRFDFGVLTREDAVREVEGHEVRN